MSTINQIQDIVCHRIMGIRYLKTPYCKQGMITAVVDLGDFGDVTVLKQKIGYDDSLDVFGVHGMCGIWGALATGIFANPAINNAARGFVYGNPRQLWIQFISIVATVAFTAVGTCIVVLITRLLTGSLRVEKENEISGLDSSVHDERAFEIV